MNRIKNVFHRSQKPMEERRPHQFIKRHSSTRTYNSSSNDAFETTQANEPPAINLSDLSEMERPAYQSWWKDLDPFNIGRINNQTILKFLKGCTLEDDKLEQILALFETAGDGLDQLQFFAMLRLIAHAQNGRKISKALVYLGAPIPHFHTNAIDALIKPDVAVTPRTNNDKQVGRRTWWGPETRSSVDDNNRHSYIGPFTTHHPVPESERQDTVMDFYYPSGDLWTAPSAPPLFTQPSPLPKSEYTHSRSKSAGNAATYTQPFDLQEQLHSSRSSLSLHELNNNNNNNPGRSLLLTQKFVYQSPSIRKQELQSTNNPFHSTELRSPFDDDDNNSNTFTHIPAYTAINNKPNSDNIPPPPVPNQDTKPPFPKYARRTTPKDLLS